MSHSLKLRICDIWKCHKMSHFFNSLVQSYVYLLCLDPARNGSHCLSRDAEHIRLAAFVGAVTKSKWGGLVWKLKNRCRQKLSSTLEKCTTIQRTPSWGIMFRDFSIFEGMKKFTNYPFDSRAHLQTVRRLWFPTSNRLETWPILSGTIQYHGSSMVWGNLPSYLLW